MMENKEYTFSYNGEDYNDGTFPTIEEALEEAKECWFERYDISDSEDGCIDIYIGEAEYYTDGIFVDYIIEQQQQDAYSEMGECAEDYLEDITKEEKAILQERLNKVWNEFKKEFNHEATFYTVANEEKYEFNIYSEEFEKYYKEEN
ncbi:hypothetical protein [Fusobacterium varium]|uniref:hypothetical protein n=1 Tax=Fusobacterium varium TaxID=856 RepID=UPI003569FCA1